MHIYWTKHLRDPEAKKKFEDYIRNSSGVLDIIKKFILEKEKTIDNPSKVDYNIQSWAYSMADTIGYRRALKEVMELLATTESKE